MIEIKIGDKYLCKVDGWTCYIKGNIYEIADVKNKSAAFISELNMLHYIEIYDLMNDFSDLQEVKREITTPKNDEIVSSVMFQLAQRSILGQQKYGTTLQENNNDDFLQHLKEELMDAILYIEKLQSIK